MTTATSPCAGCGRPVAVDAALCTHCGQRQRSEEQVQTKVGRAEKSGLPPIPAIAPGPGRFRPKQVDHDTRRAVLKAVILLLVGVGTIAIWKFAEGDHDPAKSVAYLGRFAISVAGAWVIAAMMIAMFLEIGVSLPIAALCIAAAIAGGDLTQHLCNSAIPKVPTLAWVAAIFVVMPTLADFLDMDFPDAAFLTFGIYIYKVILKLTIFWT